MTVYIKNPNESMKITRINEFIKVIEYKTQNSTEFLHTSNK